MKNALKQFMQHVNYVQAIIFFVSILVVVFILIKPTQATDSKPSLVTIFADGTERTINTGAESVADALAKAEVALDERDLVEPSLDTKIVDSAYSINVYRARPVIVIDGKKRETVFSPYQSAKLIASEAGIKVFPEDEFELSRVDDILGAGSLGQKLKIDRAKVVYLNLYGEKLELRTQAETVEELLQEKEVTLAEGETLKPSPRTPITQNMSVFIAKIGTEIITEEVEVPFEEEIIQDSSLPVGSRQIKEAGTVGRKSVTYEIILTNGSETDRKKIHEIVIKKPTKQIVIVGTKVTDPSGNVQIGQSLAAAMGWSGSEWSCLYQLWQEESGWNHSAANGSSGAYGIPQALPGAKMGSVGADWASNPATQIKWGLGYIAGRYGSPCAAYNTKSSQGWY